MLCNIIRLKKYDNMSTKNSNCPFICEMTAWNSIPHENGNAF